MNQQELQGLQEAYLSVYNQPEVINEDLQSSVKTALDTGAKFAARNPVMKAIAPFVAPVGKGKGRGPQNPSQVDASRRLPEEADLYDIILSHLLDEGYAETPESAEVIMVNMSEEWRESIVEGEENKDKEEPQKPFTGEGPKKPKGWKPTGPKRRYGERPGYAR